MTAEPRAGASAALPWVVAVLGPLSLFGPALARGHALFWGAPITQFTPWRVAAVRILKGGELPLWNPWLGTGAPLLANYQSGLLYLPNLLQVVIDPAWAATLLVMLHLIWAGAGMVLLCKRLELGALSQGVGAAAFSLSGFLVARSGFLSINATAAWLPWILLATEQLATSLKEPEGGRRVGRAALLLATCLAFQWLAGHAQITWYCFLLAFVWGIWRGSGGWRRRARTAAALGGAAGAALLLSAAQLLPTAEYLVQSARSGGVGEEFALSYSFWPWRLLGLVAPNLFGNPASGDYWGYANFWEDAIYIGVLPFALAVAGAVAGGQKHQGLRRFLLSASLLSAALALGRNTPLFPFLFRHVPSFNLFQAPTRWNIILVFSLAMLAAVGAQAWVPASGRRLYWLRLGTAGAAGVTLTAWLASRLLESLQPTLAPAVASAGLLLTAAGGLALLLGNIRRTRWLAGVLAFVLVDLILLGWTLNPTAPSALQSENGPLGEELGVAHRFYMPPDLQQTLMFDRFFRFDGFQPDLDWQLIRETGLPNLGILDRMSSVNNFDPMLSARYVELMQRLAAVGPGQREALLSWMDVGWQAVPDPGSPIGVAYMPLVAAGRAHLVPQALWAQDRAHALDLVLEPGFNPLQEVILEADSGGPFAAGGPGGVTLQQGDSANRVALEVVAPQGGWLVLADAWYPGWEAELNGEPAQVYVANVLFRAVQVPPGEHQVSFVYRPDSFAFGVGLSLPAWLATLFLLRRWREET